MEIWVLVKLGVIQTEEKNECETVLSYDSVSNTLEK